MRELVCLVLAVLLCACSPGIEPVISCEEVAGARPVCGFQNPEDLAPVDSDRQLLVSQMRGAVDDGGARGSIVVFDLASEALREVYPAGRTQEVAPTAGWGDPACPGELLTRISPHGLDLAPRPDGSLRLLVVNHGERESIEIFEVKGSGTELSLAWRGCAIPPEGLSFNDVVGLPDGGFMATHMLTGNLIWGYLRASLGMDTGSVYEWQPPGEWSVVPGSGAPFPNGLAISADGRDLYLNSYAGGEVRRISRELGEVVARGAVARPDNLSWSPDGRLLVASHVGSMIDLLQCMEFASGACPLAFEVLYLDPVSLESELVYATEGAPMGAGTVAVEVGGEIVIGSFAGDRILRVPLPGTAADE